MRILIAEDDKRLLKSLIHIFELNNYAVDGVDNGIDALEKSESAESESNTESTESKSSESAAE